MLRAWATGVSTRLVVLLLGVCVAAGCDSQEPAVKADPTTTPDRPATAPAPTSPSSSTESPLRVHLPAGPHLLFLGNSHTKRHNVPATIAAMLAAGRPHVRAQVAVAPGLLHLDERATDTATLRLLHSRRWDVVVLQAQNYSLSDSAAYPVGGSVRLVRAARKAGALPVLYAEWARRGIDETQIILDKYGAIAAREPACLPPVPEAFDSAHTRDPRLRLRASDGNHSSAAGAFLASLVLYAAITRADVASLPDLDIPRVPASLQQHLRDLAAAELRRVPATRDCP